MSNSNKPHVPPDTCPVIDQILDMLEHLAEVKDDPDWYDAVETLIKNQLEYVRSANQQLRESSKYWYDQANKGRKK